ncbi:hypothetical protein PV682_24725 [Streptomyces niveiscabiei]|uniref:hypothetical protein n=1 Tax=Streptomyces niveiscabiei TaxID=164115 RepID=UPI0029A1DB47|nr:hypothetical protein [Streptomyces niveiscabiei]MDX3384647.1 hypothetical protein [Streptomyces niveiscabiei]
MNPGRRAAPALVALLALSSCGIPATGVVEAGGPASGITPVTAVYYLRDGALGAVLRPTERPGDTDDALSLLLTGPPPGEGFTTQVRALPTAAPGNFLEKSPEGFAVTEDGSTLTVRLRDGMRELTDLAIDQVVCTVAAARRIAAPQLSVVTVQLVEREQQLARRTDGRCPQP